MLTTPAPLARRHPRTVFAVGGECADGRYAAYARSASAAYQELAPVLCSLPEPMPEFGSLAPQAVIQRLLDESDWWPRRVVDEVLRQSVPGTQEARQRMLACDDAGQLVA